MDCYRTLGAALQTGKLSDEQRAFVNGRAPNRTDATEASPPGNHHVHTPPDSNGVLKSSPSNDTPAVSGSVSMTFRLPADLSHHLMRAAVERKLKRERPFSQQDIVAEALQDWLRQHPLRE